MLSNVVVVALLLVIVGSLGSGLYFVLRDGSGSTRAVKALTVRIAVSVTAFVLLLIAAWAGWIEPNSVRGP